MTNLGADDLRCSSWTAAQRVDPAGSAGSYAGFLLLDWRSPWPADVANVEELAAVHLTAKHMGVRVQLVAPVSDREHLATFYRWDVGLGRYVGAQAPLDGRPPPDVALDLLAGRGPYQPVERSDILICGHGRRDRCCGKRGVALELGTRLSAADRSVRRTSHLGGHRFAPNAIVFPHGTWWGYLDPDSLRNIVERRQPASRHMHQYRGCSGLATPEVQAVERALLGEMGWSLLDRPRSGKRLPDGRIEFVLHEPSGTIRRWATTVAVARMVPVPVCGKPIVTSAKAEPEFAVRELVELTE